MDIVEPFSSDFDVGTDGDSAPYVAAETHPAQSRCKQNIDTVLKLHAIHLCRSATCETG